MTLKHILIGLGFCIAPAHAQFTSTSKLKQDIETLKGAVVELNDKVVTSGSDPDKQAEISSEVADLNQNVNEISERLETIEYNLNKLFKKVDDQQANVQQLLKRPAPARVTSVAAKRPVKKVIKPRATNLTAKKPVRKPIAKKPVIAKLPSTPKGKYRAAYNLIKARKFGDAERQFTAFIKANPKSFYTPNAYYWLGETHYVRGNYSKAITAFTDGYTKFPKANKASDSLLKLGLSLRATKQTTKSCEVFKSLLNNYPKATKSITDKAIANYKSLGCN